MSVVMLYLSLYTGHEGGTLSFAWRELDSCFPLCSRTGKHQISQDDSTWQRDGRKEGAEKRLQVRYPQPRGVLEELIHASSSMSIEADAQLHLLDTTVLFMIVSQSVQWSRNTARVDLYC